MTKIYAYITLAVTFAFAIAPAVTSPFMGFSEDQLPIPQIDPPIQPAGYAFSIWGLIYGWLVVSAIFGAWKRAGDPDWDKARKPLIVSLAIGAPWLAIANASAIWATITIALMAIFAITALLLSPAKDRWWFAVPVSIYAGWLTAATWVSIGSTAAGYGILLDQMGWAYAGILGALIIALVVFGSSKAPGYGLTVIWALIGIIVANGMEIWTVTAFAATGVVIMAAVVAKSAIGRQTPAGAA